MSAESARLREPHWPALVAMVADALIHFALPERFSWDRAGYCSRSSWFC